jgi:hypothetical protein
MFLTCTQAAETQWKSTVNSIKPTLSIKSSIPVQSYQITIQGNIAFVSQLQ